MNALVSPSDLHADAAPDAHMRQLASNVLWAETLGKARRVIAPFNDQGYATPFYCVHSLSGKATDYGALARMMGPGQPFYGVQVPMANRNATFGDVGPVSVTAIARHYVDAITAHQPEGALALGGWSVGAVLALEIAQQFRSAGREVRLLVAFDLAPWTDGTERRGLGYAMALVANAWPWVRHHRLVKAWSWRAFCAAVAGRLGIPMAATPGGVPARKRVQTLGTDIAVEDLVDPAHYPPAHVEQMRKMLVACMQYRAPPYDGAVQVYVARTEVPLNHSPRLEAAWRAVARDVTVTPVTGTHRRMIEEPDGVAMARGLGERLEVR